ncbi:hypothetical protein SEA_RASPUTIA_94 [Microbacterium phage Rasputia]|nr:hypothetical protein SEA_RASPUTIA_94 [Microbacterium phage Rasputia]
MSEAQATYRRLRELYAREDMQATLYIYQSTAALNRGETMEPLTIEQITFGGTTYQDVTVEVTRYMTQDGSTAIVLTNRDEYGFPGLLTKVTTNLEPAYSANPGCVFVKDYSENEGLLAAFEELGWMKATGRKELSGWVAVPEVELLGELKERVEASR